MNNFYTVEQLGPHQSMTPDGFLIVSNVPLARTGKQLYSEKEIPIKGDADGRIIIDRDPEEVFRNETIASLNGKPITIDHPDEDVSPDNYNDLAVGHVINPHRGTGVFDNLLFGDLLIHNKQAIDAIRSKQLREVSVGYKADYEQTGDARGRQRNIVCNHLALVKDGRCGPVCRIGDKAFYSVRDDEDDTDDDELPKLSHEEVNYEHPAKGQDHCSICKHYEGDGCDTVQDPIRGEDWCNRFDAAVRSRMIANKDWSMVNEAGERYQRARSLKKSGRTAGRHIHLHL